jgi:hypothetical protein
MTAQDDLLLAACKANQRQLSEVLTVVIGIAAELHPEQLREALGKVFDLPAVEDCTSRVMVVLSSVQAQARETAAEVRSLVDQVHKDLDVLEKRMDGLTEMQDRLAKRIAG